MKSNEMHLDSSHRSSSAKQLRTGEILDLIETLQMKSAAANAKAKRLCRCLQMQSHKSHLEEANAIRDRIALSKKNIDGLHRVIAKKQGTAE